MSKKRCEFYQTITLKVRVVFDVDSGVEFDFDDEDEDEALKSDLETYELSKHFSEYAKNVKRLDHHLVTVPILACPKVCLQSPQFFYPVFQEGK